MLDPGRNNIYDFLLPGYAENSSQFSKNQPKVKKGWSIPVGIIWRVCHQGDAPGNQVMKEAGPGHGLPQPLSHSLPRAHGRRSARRGCYTGGWTAEEWGEPQLASAPRPHSFTWGPSMQFLGGNWCPFSEGSVCFSMVMCASSVEKAMAPHSSTLAWKIPWMEEPGRLQSTGSQGVGHD